MQLNINSETGKLKTVLLGTAFDKGNEMPLNNPKFAEHVRQGTVPTEEQLVDAVEAFSSVLAQHDVEVLRPNNIPQHGQIFCRDICFVIGDSLFVSKMKKDNRRIEITAIEEMIAGFDKVYHPPADAFIEGGDIIVAGDYVFVGKGDRTNDAGIQFLKEKLGTSKTVIDLPLVVTDQASTNVLHLDCAFQPVGDKYGLIYKDGFIDVPEPIYDIFGADNLIEVSQQEMVDMFPNIFSISPDKVVIEKSFDRLAQELSKRGIEPVKVDYAEVSKLGGLFRCSTCPLYREDF